MVKHLCNISDAQLLWIAFDLNAEEELSSLADEFDVFLINCRPVFDGINSQLINAIAKYTRGWVEVFGFNSERIHDEIDLASVRLGRQPAVGDGIPMTVWNDTQSEVGIADYIQTGGQGTAEKKLIVIVGSTKDELAIIERLGAISS